MRKRYFICFLVMLLCCMTIVGCGKDEAPMESIEASSLPEEITIENEAHVPSEYDCIVVDGSPEGIAAAISASRNGMKTLLICQDDALGGLYTLGELNFIDIPESRQGELLVNGIFKEFSDAVGGSGFDIIRAKNTFYNMVDAEDNLTLRVESKFSKPIMNGNQITGIEVVENDEKIEYFAPYIIDATQDGDVCAAAGAPYTFAGEDIGEKDRVMGVTLVFRLSGVDWDKVSEHILTPTDGTSNVEGGVSGNLAWGYGKEGYAYEPVDQNLRMRGFNIARQENGDVLINSLIIFDVDALDADSRAEGIARGQKELPEIVKYMRETCVGFENAELADTAEQLYVRETRHIECEHMLSINDVLENRWQPDAIAVTNYPVDVQATKTMRFGMVVGFPDQYTIGYRSLVPQKIDGLLIVGRSAGYRSLAAGSARIVPAGMACGQAAGVAAKIAADNKCSFRELSEDKEAIEQLQTTLKEQGANLTHQETKEPFMNHWSYDGLKVIRSMGNARGGYDNNYELDSAVAGPSATNMLNTVAKKSGFGDMFKIEALPEKMTCEQLILPLATNVAALENEAAPVDFTGAVAILQEKGMLDDVLYEKLSNPTGEVDGGSMYMLSAHFYEYLQTLPGAITLEAVDRLPM